MRLAILTNDYPPRARGGAGVVAETYARELERRGHEVKVFLKNADLYQRSAFNRLLFHVQDLWPRRSLVQEISTWKPDVLLTHNLTGCGFATPRLIQRRGIRWIHFLHDVQLF